MSNPFHVLTFLDVFPGLRDVALRDVLCLADYDMTLAAKCKVNFDKAHLTPQQHRGLQFFSEKIGLFSVVTARGEASSLAYLNEHGPLKAMLASNSGHIVRASISPLSPREYIPIPGYTNGSINHVVGHIHGMAETLAKAFPSILCDLRELCSAVVFQFNGQKGSEEHSSFCTMAYDLKAGLPEEVSDKVLFSEKHLEVAVPQGGIQTQGYIDIKPGGMDKGLVTTKIFDGFVPKVANPFVIVAGDSGPDYDMMVAIDKHVPPARRLFISVGEGLIARDTRFAEAHRGRGGLLDIILPGPQDRAVQTLHDLYAVLGNTPHRALVSPQSMVIKPYHLAA